MAHRTTLTLHDDVYEAARAEATRTGRRLRDVINEALRRGLEDRSSGEEPVALLTIAATMRTDVVSTGALLDLAEGPAHR